AAVERAGDHAPDPPAHLQDRRRNALLEAGAPRLSLELHARAELIQRGGRAHHHVRRGEALRIRPARRIGGVAEIAHVHGFAGDPARGSPARFAGRVAGGRPVVYRTEYRTGSEPPGQESGDATGPGRRRSAARRPASGAALPACAPPAPPRPARFLSGPRPRGTEVTREGRPRAWAPFASCSTGWRRSSNEVGVVEAWDPGA